ncbi:MAG: HYR domain-containing protein [Saprospiraceae bacterium]|nr:HYR domain-containing protein [Saprospiraceae bacterium]
MKQNKSSRLGALWTFLIVLFSQIPAQAGLITCGDNLNLSPSVGCMVTADADFVITTSDCTGPYWLVAKELDGDTIVWGVGTISFDATAYLGTTITIQVKDIPSGNACESDYDVYDGQFPSITCPMDTVGCTASLDPSDLKDVISSDNCGVDTLFYQDIVIGPSCLFMPAAFIARVDRTWTVQDIYGNETSCVQNILIRRADTSMVQIPADITIECTASTHPDSTGRPTINGLPIVNGGLCNMNVSYTDLEIPSDCGTRPILRRWVVSDNCIIADVKIETQVILLQDIEPPVFTGCGDSLFYQTDVGVCNTDIMVDMPNVTDNCSEFAVQASIPGFPVTTDFTFQNVPKGMHLVTFVATDSCGNISAPCTRKIFVIDNETPTAICKNFPVVALPSNGTVAILASVFNAGSYDNCPGPLVYTGSRDGVIFAPTVTFTCADAGDTIMVFIKVAESANPASFNTCMTQVLVQDKIPPGITCPPDLTIQCTADYSDLSVFGSPFVYDPCGFTLEVDSTIDIQNCGVGTIIREFTATDSSGNSSSCTQVITVINSMPYNGQGIVWPLDTMLVNYCSGPGLLGPANLPAPYNFPVTPTTSCAMLATNYTDQFFDISSPACYKIVRTWKVIDWCQYNPANPYVGIWKHQQIIAVVDNVSPVITFCPTDTIVSVGLDCNLANAVFFPVTATDCSPEITFTNNSPYATSGADASGLYPQGQYPIIVTAEDGCGNKSTCQFTLTVTDLKPPTPYCNTGIVAELQAMGGQIMAFVQAEQFNDNSYDNCSDQSDLDYTIRLVGDPNPPTDALFFDCEDIGEYLVEVWVTDEAGNGDFCVTSVFIQDNMDLCPFMDDTLVVNGASIEGIVESMMGEEMPEVEVAAANTGMMAETDDTGVYEINGLQQGGSYTIAPQKDVSPLNGVTSFDLVLMTSHVLGTAPFNSPYKLIAADANRSGAVTTLDILEVRKLILHMYDDFPNNTSWRFVPKNYVFPNPANPFTPTFPEALNLTIGQQTPDADFVGIKIGDVNGSAYLGLTGDDTEGRTSAILPFVTDDRELVAGEEITVPIKTTTASDLLAIQFTLEFETDDLELRGYEKGVLPSLGDDAFGKSLLGQGVLTAAWFNPTPAALKKDDALFNLRFLVKKPGRLSEMLSMTARYTDALAYQTDGQPSKPVLEFSNQNDLQTSAGFQLYQNQPNPFKQSTRIGFTLPERGDAKLTIYDTDGRVLKAIQRSFDKGYNEVAVERSELQSGGVVYYKLETPSHTAVKKMILL